MENSMKKIKAVLFDLDGTLLNTLKDIQVAVNVALEQFGYPVKTETEVAKALGKGPLVLMKRLSGVESQKLVEVYKEYYDEHLSEYTSIYPGISELLDSLRKRDLKLGVLSNKHHSGIEKICDVYFPGVFTFLLGTGAGFERKPDPAGLLYLIKKMDLSPEEVIYVGDSSVDLEVAKNAGCRGYLVDWGYGNRKEEAEIKSPEDLLDLF